MFMRRRRPLMRAAMVGGSAYYAGKMVQQRRQRDAELDADSPNVESLPAAPAAGGLSDATMDQLKKLGDLKTQGLLTIDEFVEQKQKLLQPA